MGTELSNTVDIGFSRQTSILNMEFSVTLKFFRAQLLLCKESVARQSEQELTILLLFDFMFSANFILDQTFWLPPWSKQS